MQWRIQMVSDAGIPVFGHPNHVPNVNASTGSQAVNLSNTLKNIELQTLCIPVSTTLACINISRYRLYKPFHNSSMPKLTTGYTTDLGPLDYYFHKIF